MLAKLYITLMLCLLRNVCIGQLSEPKPSNPQQLVLGRIVTQTGEGLPGAYVFISGEKTSSDADGYFHLFTRTKPDSIIVKSTGYRTTRVKAVKGQVIVLPDDKELLREVGETLY